MKYNEVSVIVPAHNAEKIIEKSLISYSKFFSKLFSKYELIVVANACNDNTLELVKKQCKKNKNIRLFETKKRGKGRAILVGFKHARFKLIGFIDADDVFDHQSIKNMFSKIDGYDCVIASKWLGQKFSQVREPFSRKIFAVGWNLMSRVLLELKIADTQAGCKFMKKSAFDSIDQEFICLGWDFDVELLFKLARKKYKIKEFFIPISQVFSFSVFKLRHIPGMFWRMLKLWSRKIE